MSKSTFPPVTVTTDPPTGQTVIIFPHGQKQEAPQIGVSVGGETLTVELGPAP